MKAFKQQQACTQEQKTNHKNTNQKSKIKKSSGRSMKASGSRKSMWLELVRIRSATVAMIVLDGGGREGVSAARETEGFRF